jgi:hypothetical protein
VPSLRRGLVVRHGWERIDTTERYLAERAFSTMKLTFGKPAREAVRKMLFTTTAGVA